MEKRLSVNFSYKAVYDVGGRSYSAYQRKEILKREHFENEGKEYVTVTVAGKWETVEEAERLVKELRKRERENVTTS